MEQNKKVKIGVILFGILYLAIGLADLIGGASYDSRFYYFDDILIRFIGLVFIVSSIGMFLRKEIARRGIIIALSLSIIEIFIGVPTEANEIELVGIIILLLMLYLPGLIYFCLQKNNEYFR